MTQCGMVSGSEVYEMLFKAQEAAAAAAAGAETAQRVSPSPQESQL